MQYPSPRRRLPVRLPPRPNRNMNEKRPALVYATRAEAVTEAERLARANPGRIFVVLEAVEAVRKVDVERVDLLPPGSRLPRERRGTDDIPF